MPPDAQRAYRPMLIHQQGHLVAVREASTPTQTQQAVSLAIVFEIIVTKMSVWNVKVPSHHMILLLGNVNAPWDFTEYQTNMNVLHVKTLVKAVGTRGALNEKIKVQ